MRLIIKNILFLSLFGYLVLRLEAGYPIRRPVTMGCNPTPGAGRPRSEDGARYSFVPVGLRMVWWTVSNGKKITRRARHRAKPMPKIAPKRTAKMKDRK